MTKMSPQKRLAVSALALLCLASATEAQDLRRVTLVQSHSTIGVGEEVFLYAVPKAMGYFEAEGLDVLSQTAKNGVQVGQMLEGRNAEYGTIGTDTLLLSEEKGGHLKAFYHLKQHNGSVVAVLKGSGIDSFDDLAGKTVGVSSIGYGGHMFLQYAMTAEGIGPDKYTVIATGAGPAAAAALQDGTVQALSLWDAMFARMENNGLELEYIQYPLMDRIAGLNLGTTEAELADHPESAVGMCRAIAKGLHFTLTNQEAALKIFYDVFPTTKPADVPVAEAAAKDAKILEAWLTYAQRGVAYGEDTGQFTPDRFVAYADYLKEKGNLVGDFDPTTVYDASLLDQCNDFDRDAIAAEAKAYDAS